MMEINYQLADFPFKHKIKTRWRDLDAFKHVNNATFFNYIEDARNVLFRKWNLNLEEKSIIMASAKIDYISQINHPSNLIIGQKISRIGNKSFDITSAIFEESNKNNPVCISFVTIVCFDFINNNSVKVFEEIKLDYDI